MIILLLVLVLLPGFILLFGFGGFSMRPGVGYYGGGTVITILVIVLILRLLGVI